MKSASEPEETHAYVARKPCCKAVVYIGVDDASPELAREIAKLIRDGRTIERVSLEDVRNSVAAEMSSDRRCTCEPSAAEKKVIARRVREKKKLVSGFVTRRSK